MPDTTPPRRVRQPAKSRRQRASSFEVPDNEVDMEESEDEAAPQSSRRQRHTRQATDSHEDGEEDGEEAAPRTPGRRLTRRKPKQDRQEQEDLAEDLDFLQSSPPGKNAPTSSSSKPQNERQKALAALKRRRAAAEPSSSATPGRSRAVVLSDTDADSDLEIIHEEKEVESDKISDDMDEDDDDEHSPNALAVFREVEGDEDFIDDDPDELIGAPAAETSLPLQFSSISRAKPRELFKYAVEWMVQKKINPAFSIDDEIYDLTFRKLDDEVGTLANSKFSSSVWTKDFTRALRARPDVMIDEIGKGLRALEMAHCEACNRKTHPATWNMSFSGKPYHKETLEPLGDDDDESSSDTDSDSSLSSHDSASNPTEPATYDAQGELIAPESRIFTLGSTCKANAQMAHTLHHWRYHLNSWVVDYLVRQGHCTPEKLVERDGWSVRKRQKAANKIVDRMEKEGEIRKLHRLYKDQIDFAQEARNEYRDGWGRN
ncbi:hypothetical protein K491DRAFT_605340 [Lophiostoma macrostomum CBS 122681]|uniref:DUF4211 domain-containing protein n=1 Tax=Lophiostoma macrostomum CBS 122681 TaxID=1314788 RepID=A0A6A6T142_9PLEO|nr:hypothetical protein K491DRAFT_605340 [Lophiostoma macrostomum CBS 122681]